MQDYVPMEVSEDFKYRTFFGFTIFLMLSAFFFNSPAEIIEGYKIILVHPGVLLTDYMSIANIGTALFNSGSVAFLLAFMAKKLRAAFNGPMMAALFTVAAFCLFGKNPYNITSLIFGVYLRSRIRDEQFAPYLVSAFFMTGLAPMVSQVSFGFGLDPIFGIILGNVMGIFVGLITPGLATNFVIFHKGFSLYNMGFTLGMVGLLMNSLLKSFGLVVVSESSTLSGYNFQFTIFLLIIFIAFFFLKFYLSKMDTRGIKSVMNKSGQLVTDTILLDGFDSVLLNMAILGSIGLAYVHIVGGELNGPSIGGILSMVGFAGYGKNAKNVIPIILGVWLAAVLEIWTPSAPAILIAALFGTTLAPMAGTFGVIAGIFTGFVHLTLVTSTGLAHDGMNLYNNGFAAGIAAAIVSSIILSFFPKEEGEQVK